MWVTTPMFLPVCFLWETKVHPHRAFYCWALTICQALLWILQTLSHWIFFRTLKDIPHPSPFYWGKLWDPHVKSCSKWWSWFKLRSIWVQSDCFYIWTQNTEHICQEPCASPKMSCYSHGNPWSMWECMLLINDSFHSSVVYPQSLRSVYVRICLVP